jgi:uncharacterized membrane protein
MVKHVRTSLRRYFITGLLIVTPIWGTYLVLKTLLTSMEGILGRVLERYAVFYVPGLGVILLVLLILFAGMLATNIFGRKIVEFWDDLVQRVPLVRGIYSVFKAIVDAISLQSKSQFNRVVLIEFPRKGQYSFAFVTGVTEGEVQEKTHEKVLNVYVPTTPNPTSGYFLLVPESEIIPLTMSVEDAMKMIISGGYYTPPSPSELQSAGKNKTRGGLR